MNIRMLLATLVRHIRLILIMMIICAIFAGGYKYYQIKMAAMPKTETTVNEAKDNKEKEKLIYFDEERLISFSQIIRLDNEYKINPYATIQAYNNAEDISALFQYVISSSGIQEKIAMELGGIWNTYRIQKCLVSKAITKDIFEVTFICDDIDSSKKAVETAISIAAVAVKNVYPSVKITEASENSSLIYDPKVIKSFIDQKKEFTEQGNKARTQLANAGFGVIVVFAFIGAIMGLMLGIILAVIADSLSKRLYSPLQIERECDYPMLGSVSIIEKGRKASMRAELIVKLENVNLVSINDLSALSKISQKIFTQLEGKSELNVLLTGYCDKILLNNLGERLAQSFEILGLSSILDNNISSDDVLNITEKCVVFHTAPFESELSDDIAILKKVESIIIVGCEGNSDITNLVSMGRFLQQAGKNILGAIYLKA